MAYQSNSTVVISDDFAGSFANVTIQNNGFLEVNSSDGFQGTVAGYTSGGFIPGVTDIISKFPFAVDTNATDVGDLIQAKRDGSGQSSSTHGYITGGFPLVNTIQKFPFAVDTNSVLVGRLNMGTSHAGTGQSSSTHGYHSGGIPTPPTTVNTIDKFPFSVDSNSTDVGDLTQGRYASSGQSSNSHGYNSGGQFPPATTTNVIDKFPFATDTNATDVGDLTQSRTSSGGQSSITHGYASGGHIPPPNTPPNVNTIEKFPFSSDTNSTDIGDLTLARGPGCGQSSTTHGYTSGGYIAPANRSNVIDKFPFAVDTNATDVGDLTVTTQNTRAGQQD